MASSPPAPDRIRQKARLKQTSMQVQQYSEDIINGGAPPSSPEELTELGKRVASALSDSQFFKLTKRDRIERIRTTTRLRAAKKAAKDPFAKDPLDADA